MASLTLTVGTKSFTKQLKGTDAEVRTKLRNFGKSMEPELPPDATLQQELDDIGEKIIRVISSGARKYRYQELQGQQSGDLNEQARVESEL